MGQVSICTFREATNFLKSSQLLILTFLINQILQTQILAYSCSIYLSKFWGVAEEESLTYKAVVLNWGASTPKGAMR